MIDIFKPYRGLPREVYIIFFSRMINAAGLFIFPLFTLILTKKIGLSSTEAGFYIMLVGLMFIPSNMIGGKLTDLFGRKKLIVGFESLGGLLYLICGFIEPSMTQIYLILAACFFFGMAEPANTSLIADVTTPENRDGAYSLSYMGFNMGFAIGPIVGGLLFENHYPWIFWGDALSLLAAVALVAFFVEETFDRTKVEVGEDRVLEQSTNESIFKVLLARPVLLWFAGILLLYNFSYSQWHFLLPLHMEQAFKGHGAAVFGVLASINGLVVMICTPLLTSAFRNVSDLKRVTLGGILYMFGFGMLGFVTGKLAFFMCCIVFTLGEILITISFMPFLANRTPASHRGRMNAVIPIIMGVGYSLGPLAMGRGLAYFSIETGWKAIGIVMAVAIVLMRLLEISDRKLIGTESEIVSCD